MDFRTLTSNSRAYNQVSLLIAALLAGIALFFLLYFEVIRLYPFKLQSIDEHIYQRRKQVYVDLQNDAFSEQLVVTSYSNAPVLELYTENGAFRDVYRIKGDLLDDKFSFFTGDADRDNSAEIYLLTISNDSVLLNAYEPYGNDGHFIEDHLISISRRAHERNNIRLVYAGLEDTDADHEDELLFILRAGDSLIPRQVFTLDPKTLVIRKSFESAAGYNSLFPYRDSTGMLQLVLTGSSAFENYEPWDSVLFNDNSGWIIAYSPDLSDTLFVREYSENKSYLFPMIREEAGGKYIYTMNVALEEGICRLEKISLDGKLVKEVIVADGLNSYTFLNTLLPELESLVVLHEDTLHYFNHKLEVEKKVARAGDLIFRLMHLDNQAYKAAGFLPFIRGKRLIIRDFQLNVLAKYNLDVENISGNNLFSVKSVEGEHEGIISFRSDTDTYHLRVKKNPLFKFRHVAYMLVYGLIFFFFYLIFYLQIFYFKRRFIRQHLISELQLQAVQNQLQPHFTFNVLNTIGSMIYKNKREEAYDYLNRFSEMLRSTLLSRSKLNWKIREELDFISTYMEMENLRFGNKFQYELIIEKGMDMNLLVPRMIVQSYVENSVKHGLMHNEGKGILKLTLSREKRHLKIIIQDNGIGRKAAAMLERNQSGLGNSILENYIEIYNSYNKTKFIFTIDDLEDREGNATGTRVILLIPDDIKTIKSGI